MTNTIAVINQKGGVGKSTTALALGSALARRNYRVLFADLDAQGNLSHTLGADPDQPTAFEVLTRAADGRAAVQETPGGRVIASSPALAGADAVINATGKEFRLREALEPLGAGYDFIIIDTPPALGILTVNALTAADWLLVPAQADIYSLQGIGQLHQTIVPVRQYCNPGLKILGLVLTRHNPRSVLSRDLTDVLSETAAAMESRLFKTAIRETVAVREAQAQRQNLFDYAPKSTAALDYQALAEEILAVVGNDGQ